MPRCINTLADAKRVSDRLWRMWVLDVPPEQFDLSGHEELTPEHEGDLAAEYGYDAIVRYYAPTDPRLEPL